MVCCKISRYTATHYQLRQPPMDIISLGLNHHTAPVHLRERLAFNEEQIRASLSRLTCGHAASPLAELVIVSTCNRTEIYAASNRPAFAELEAFLSDARDVPVA